MEPGAPVSKPQSVATRTLPDQLPDQLTEEQADQQYAKLQSRVGEQARNARTMADAAAVADHVAILKRHRPRAYDVVASAAVDGSGFREHGFATATGFVGLEDARVLCEHHDELTPWPCAVIEKLTGNLDADQPAQEKV